MRNGTRLTRWCLAAKIVEKCEELGIIYDIISCSSKNMLLAHNEQLWQSARKWSDRMRLRGCSWCSNCWTGRTCTSCCWWSWWCSWADALTWGSFKRETSTLTLYRVPDGIDPMLTCLETHIYQVDVNHLLASILHQKIFFLRLVLRTWLPQQKW